MENIPRKKQTEKLPKSNVVQFPKNNQVILPTKGRANIEPQNERLNFNDILSEGQIDSTVAIYVSSDTDFGINSGDYAIVNVERRIKPSEIVLAISGETKRLFKASEMPANYKVAGVVTYIVKKMEVA